MALTVSKIVVELQDGRTFDITHLPPGEAVAYLRAQGVKLGEIKNTLHYLSGAVGTAVATVHRSDPE